MRWRTAAQRVRKALSPAAPKSRKHVLFVYLTRRLLCSCFLVVTWLPIKDDKTLSKKELNRSLQAYLKLQSRSSAYTFSANLAMGPCSQHKGLRRASALESSIFLPEGIWTIAHVYVIGRDRSIICMYINMCVYIYIYVERERYRERERERKTDLC